MVLPLLLVSCSVGAARLCDDSIGLGRQCHGTQGSKERRALIPVLKQCGLVNLGFTVLYALAVLVHQYV